MSNTHFPTLEPESPIPGSRSTWFQIILRAGISLGISVLLLVLIFRLAGSGGEGIDHQQVLKVLARTAWPFVVLYFLMQIAQTMFRSERYRVLIRGGGEADVPPRFHMFLVTAVRNMCVDMFPARLGELTYVAMMNRGYRVSVNVCLSSLAVSLLFDFIALFFVFAAALVLPLMASEMRGAMLTGLVGIALVSVIVAIVLFVGLRVGLRVLKAILSCLPAALREHRLTMGFVGFCESVADAVETTRRSGLLIRTFLLSMGVRVCKYAGLYFVFLAVTLPSYKELSGAPFWNVLTALLAAEGAASLPLPSFMSFGAYEAGGLLALKLLGFSAVASAVTMLVMHIVSQVVDYSLGGLALVVFAFAGPGADRAVGRGWRRAGLLAVTLAGCAVVVLGGLWLVEHRRAAKRGATEPPPQGAAVTVDPDEAGTRQDAVRDIEGFVVWSSNRHGQHDIVRLDLPGMKLTRLTHDPHVDTFPRISPDGKRIVFARSREPWVSQRREKPWDVYVLDLASGEERLLAEWGNVPTWSADGTRVYFQRDAGTLIEHELASGAERVLYAAGSNGVPDGVSLQTPSMESEHGRMAVTLRGAKRGTALFQPDGKMTKVGGGCQLTWASDFSHLFYVDHGGRGKNRVYRYRTDDPEPEAWLDLSEPYSHEYFPRMSNDGRYLVLGASADGHEHDTADYEIFLWEIGAPEEDAVRLTYHTGNDCWPDVYITGR